MHSVKRLAKRVCKTTILRQAFECIGYNIPKMESKEAVETLFDVMKGAKPVRDAAVLLLSQKVLHDVPPKTSNKDLLIAEAWCGWWTRQKHMGML